MMRYLRKNVRSIMLIIVVLFVVSCFAGYGIRGGGGADGSGASDGARDYEVAVVNGERIMRSRIEADMFQMIQSLGAQAATISDDDYPSLRSAALDQMAVASELDKEVAARNIAVTDDEVNGAIAEIQASFPTREIYMQEMTRAGLDEKKLGETVRTQISRQKLFDQVVSPVSTDVGELNTFYDMMKAYAFQKPEGFKMNLANFTKMESAERARSEIAGGKPWDEVMESVSSDILNQTPYDSPVLIALDQLVGDAESLKDLPLNEISGVTSLTSDDFMIAIKRSKEEVGTATFDEVSADLEQMILGQKRQGLQSQFLQELRSRAQVEILDDSIFYKPEPIEPDPVSGDETSGDIASPDTTPAEVPSEQPGIAPAGDAASPDAAPAAPPEAKSGDSSSGRRAATISPEEMDPDAPVVSEDRED
ncbi:MAG: SurA N-terminal domain-containing protein [Synergistaceae bacterium]|jgi:hypothetical protein|nr:SurA N-terminal domain-containing protein [Synergistaceae bacterium]